MIKWIAVILMIIDHIGYYLGFLMPEPVVLLLRLVGRLSFPLFAYSISLGFLRTKNRTRYFTRMLLFAAITQALLMLASYFTRQEIFTNVMFTFSLAILFMAASQLLEKAIEAIHPSGSPNAAVGGESSLETREVKEKPAKSGVEIYGRMIPVIPAILLAAAAMLVILGLTYRFHPDYNIFGLFTVYLFYYILKKRRNPDQPPAKDKRTLLIMFFSFLGLNLLWALYKMWELYKIVFTPTQFNWILMEIFSVFSIGFLLLEKPGLKPARLEKYFFYIFYPAHLVLFMIIRFFLPQLIF